MDELTKIQPPDLAINQIFFRLGSPWIPTDTIKDFMADLLNVSDADVKYIETPDTSRWNISMSQNASWALRNNATVQNVWGVEGANALSLIEDSLNLRVYVRLRFEYDAEQKKEKPVFNPQKSQAAREMQRKIQEEFPKWTRNHEKWSGELAEIYNRDFNNTRLEGIPHTGDRLLPQRLPCAQTEGPPKKVHFPKPSGIQRRGPFRGDRENLHLRHDRHGDAPLRDGPETHDRGSKLHGSSICQGLPAALPHGQHPDPDQKAALQGEPEKAHQPDGDGNWDAVIIPHSAFDMISVTPEKEAAYIREQIGEFERVIREMESGG